MLQDESNIRPLISVKHLQNLTWKTLCQTNNLKSLALGNFHSQEKKNPVASEATLANAWMQASGCHLSAVFLRQSQFLRDPEYVQLTSTSSVGSQLLPGFNSLTGALGMLFLGGPNPHLEYVNVLTLTMYFFGNTKLSLKQGPAGLSPHRPSCIPCHNRSLLWF